MRLILPRKSRNLLLASIWLALFGTAILLVQSNQISGWARAGVKAGIEVLRSFGELIPGASPYPALAVLAAVFWITVTGVTYVVRYSRLRQQAMLREYALARREERAQDLLDQVADALLLVNAEGEILDCNNSAIEMFGYAAEELVGSKAAELLSNPIITEELTNRRAAFAAFDAESADSSDPPVRFLVRQKGGLTFPVEVSVGQAEISGEILYAAIIRDVSEKARLEAELSSAQLDAEAASQLTQKIAALAADSSFICQQEIAAVTVSRRESGRSLDPFDSALTILRTVRALRVGLDEIASAAGPEAERVEKFGVRFSPDRLVEDVAQSIVTEDGERNFEIFTFLDPDVPSQLYGDPAPLRILLSQLTEFAASTPTPGALGLELRVKEQIGDQVALQLSLSGSAFGFAEAELLIAQNVISGSVFPNASGDNFWEVPLIELNSVVERVGGQLTIETVGKELCKLTATGWFHVADDQPIVTNRTSPTLEGRGALIVNLGGTGTEFLSMQLSAAGMLVHSVDGDKDAAESVMAAKNRGTPYDLIVMNRRPGPSENCDPELNRVLRRFDMAPRVMVLGLGRLRQHTTAEFDDFETDFVKPIHQSAIIPEAARLIERVMAAKDVAMTGQSRHRRTERAKISDKCVSDFA